MKTANNINLAEVAARIRELREIYDYSVEFMAQATGTTVAEYLLLESGLKEPPFSFIHKCALTFGVGMSDITTGRSASLSSYAITRRGQGQITAQENGIQIVNLAPEFRNKIGEPYWVTYKYAEELQTKPIALSTHSGQEFDLVLRGKLKIQIGDHLEVLGEGDSIFYDSSTPHGMIAIDGEDCDFCAIILPGEKSEGDYFAAPALPKQTAKELVANRFISCTEEENGSLSAISFHDEESFNFAFDVVDALAVAKPDKIAMLHVDAQGAEQRFTFEDMRRNSNRAANYFRSLGIKKGDRVLLALRRSHCFWFAMLGLHKLGAVAVPVAADLSCDDYLFRLQRADISAVLCLQDCPGMAQLQKALQELPRELIRIAVGGEVAGWHSFEQEYQQQSPAFSRTADSPAGSEQMLIYFTSGTTGQPKMVQHSYHYPLAHFATAAYWQRVESEGLHFTIADTGWAKSVWSMLYGQWLCEAAVFVYDFAEFDALAVLPLFAQYGITSFCAPPAVYRALIKQDLSRFDLSSVHHATAAGDALNPEVFLQFRAATGLSIHEGFGQTEAALLVGNMAGQAPKIGSMGKPNPQYQVDVFIRDNQPARVGECGEIVVLGGEGGKPYGLFGGYYHDEAATRAVWRDGVYHTGDLAWKDEDGYFWYVGRSDDMITTAGYLIGPFEIENIIMELPYVLECGVCGQPDPLRGQIIKASIVLADDIAATDAQKEELKKEIQLHVRQRTAPYKYPRVVEFTSSLPKTVSGKIIHHLL